MATIVYREGRAKPYLTQIHRKGHKVYSKAFELKANAERWAREQERSLETVGLPTTIKEYESITVADLVSRYIEKVTPQKASHKSETIRLQSFLKRDIAKKSIAYVSTQDAASYRDKRLGDTFFGKPISPSTIRREVNTLQNIFEIARTEWGYTNLKNPFRGLTIRNANRRRTRRLKEGEIERLIEATNQCYGYNGWFVALAVVLAAETGMRLQEIFNLSLEDIGFSPTTPDPIPALDKRRIVIRKSKTDYKTGEQGRTIVMSCHARNCLMTILALHIRHDISTLTPTLFPMSKGAFSQAWDGVRRRAGITDLTFHDLRHEAGSRLDQLGLTKGEHDLMMGHKSRDMASLYIHADLKHIQEKLDKPWYEIYKTRRERQIFGLAFRGDEIEDKPTGETPSAVSELETIYPLGNVIQFPRSKISK